MADPTYRTYGSTRDWNATSSEGDLEPRLHQVELRVTALEATLEHRLAQLKAEIQAGIWEDRLKGLFLISVGVAVVTWLRLVVGLVQ